MDPEQVQRLQHLAARALLGVVRDGGFVKAELFWSELAGSSSATLTVVDADRTSAMVKTPHDIFDLLEDLRSEMAEPDRGAWLSVCARVSADGGCEFDFNHDRRPYWNSPDHFEPTARDATDPNPSDEHSWRIWWIIREPPSTSLPGTPGLGAPPWHRARRLLCLTALG